MKKYLNRRTFIKNTSLGAMAAPLLIKHRDWCRKIGTSYPGIQDPGKDRV